VITPQDELIAAAEIGEEGRKFLKSDLGKTLIGLADQSVQRALEQLETVSPVDTEKIRAFQNEAKLGRMFTGWLIDLVQDGENAMEIFKNEKEQQ